MGKSSISESEIIQMTRDNVRSFYNRNPEITTAPMAKDFMWIGSNDFQWCEGLESFLQVTKKEYEEPPVYLSDEEYHLLFHERNVWVLYGRYQVTPILEDGSVMHAHVRGTYVWKRINGVITLAHVHGSHAQDIPLNQLVPSAKPLTSDSDYFEFMKRLDSLKTNGPKLDFRDREKRHRYLHPSEIIYMQAALQWTTVYTTNGSFQAYGLLAAHEQAVPEDFQRIHKSFLVNTGYIRSLCRYEATLLNGQVLPVSKERYMSLKRFLEKRP